MDKKFISLLLRNQFYPLLKAQGFTKKADVFWQVDGEVIRIVDIQHFKKRHCFQINLGIHLIPLGEYVMGCTGRRLEFEKMRDYDCAWRGSIISGLVNDYDSDWSYTQSEQDAIQMVEFLVSEWDRQSQLFFGEMAQWPEDFIKKAIQAIKEPIHPSEMCTLCYVSGAAGDLELVKDLAEVALPSVPERATSLKARLEAFLQDPSLAIPQITQ
ncbi:DUF4304 domain-containing protein [Acinetobacter bereziniae]|jgi:hypothetical protein|uniref:DUF4304 domain-containing protein n=2 Tax=Acinetobacter bereziniae TaxID=106648 RepID=N8YQS3_ACIBZ|nr:DUF4304 domain-containing protein [Acinetobacter bereziniae]ENV21570.1 hypothetical protein F963_02386 [Acinetobacter bereziniae NIPH 3]